jgi:hypothetical protein
MNSAIAAVSEHEEIASSCFVMLTSQDSGAAHLPRRAFGSIARRWGPLRRRRHCPSGGPRAVRGHTTLLPKTPRSLLQKSAAYNLGKDDCVIVVPIPGRVDEGECALTCAASELL